MRLILFILLALVPKIVYADANSHGECFEVFSFFNSQLHDAFLPSGPQHATLNLKIADRTTDYLYEHLKTRKTNDLSGTVPDAYRYFFNVQTKKLIQQEFANRETPYQDIAIPQFVINDLLDFYEAGKTTIIESYPGHKITLPVTIFEIHVFKEESPPW